MGLGRINKDHGPLYRRLPLGPHQMTREEVASNQRTRLYGAMIEAVSTRSYQKLTTSDLIGLAGVSRRAFYELFANKEECFLGTYDILVARSNRLAHNAWGRERGWANRLHAGLKAVLDDCAVSPKGAHLVLVDSLGIGPAVRERMHVAASSYEHVVGTAFDLAPEGIGLPPLLSRAIVGGVRQVMFTRLRDGRPEELLHMTDELLDWVSAYTGPPGRRLEPVVPTAPPKIPPTRAAFLASDDVRSRTLDSVVQLTLKGGFRGLTDPQIAQHAGTSTDAFHKQFGSKRECFLAVLDELAAEAAQAVRDSVGSASSWSEGVRLAVIAYTRFFVARPELIRMAFIDVFEVGPALVSRLTSTIEDFTNVLDETGPEPARSPTIVAEAITGAIWAILANCAASDRLPYLPYLADHITFIVLAPYVGAKQAMATIEAGRAK